MSIDPKIIDHTNLNPEATEADIEKLCEEAKKYEFGAVCIGPEHVTLAKRALVKTRVRICAVIGFPSGIENTEQKFKEAERAILDGADELDMVINIGALKRGDLSYIKKDIAAVRHVSRDQILKVIIETGVLDEVQIKKACGAIIEAGANFVCTSTGFAKDKDGNKLGATIEEVKLIKSLVEEKIGIKACGGVHTAELAEKLLEAGANRLGSSAAIMLISNH